MELAEIIYQSMIEFENQNIKLYPDSMDFQTNNPFSVAQQYARLPFRPKHDALWAYVNWGGLFCRNRAGWRRALLRRRFISARVQERGDFVYSRGLL